VKSKQIYKPVPFALWLLQDIHSWEFLLKSDYPADKLGTQNNCRWITWHCPTVKWSCPFLPAEKAWTEYHTEFYRTWKLGGMLHLLSKFLC